MIDFVFEKIYNKSTCIANDTTENIDRVQLSILCNMISDGVIISNCVVGICNHKHHVGFHPISLMYQEHISGDISDLWKDKYCKLITIIKRSENEICLWIDERYLVELENQGIIKLSGPMYVGSNRLNRAKSRANGHGLNRIFWRGKKKNVVNNLSWKN